MYTRDIQGRNQTDYAFVYTRYVCIYIFAVYSIQFTADGGASF